MNLQDLLRANLIELNISVRDWEEATRAVGKLLVADNAVEPQFVDAMIRVVKEFGPYIVLAPGVAMPHARPEDGCIRSSIGLITLAEPVNFGNPDNDPVTVVIALAAADQDEHVQALAELADVIGEDGAIAGLTAARTIAEVLKIMWSKSDSGAVA